MEHYATSIKLLRASSISSASQQYLHGIHHWNTFVQRKTSCTFSFLYDSVPFQVLDSQLKIQATVARSSPVVYWFLSLEQKGHYHFVRSKSLGNTLWISNMCPKAWYKSLLVRTRWGKSRKIPSSFVCVCVAFVFVGEGLLFLFCFVF